MTETEIKNEAKKIRTHVNNMINETFEILKQIYNNDKTQHTESFPIAGRLIFPNYRGATEDIRISEQELRFVFTEVFNKYCKNNEVVSEWYYSVETPTMEKYNFKGKQPRIDPKGKSASFDFVIHNQESIPICLIEFKARNPEEFKHHKDFFKLTEDPKNAKYPPYTQCYFLEVLNGCDRGTITSLTRKLTKYKEFLFRYTDTSIFATPYIRFCCYSLKGYSDSEHKEETVYDITDEIISKLKPANNTPSK